MISRHHDNLFAEHFEIKKTRELVARKYFWPTFRQDVEVYMKGCNICLALKTVRYKQYEDLQFLPILIYWWNDFFIDFVTGFPLLVDLKSNSYDAILIIIDQLTKMIHYKVVKSTIDVSTLTEVIINIVIRYYGLLEFIISDLNSVFISKF